MEKNNRTKAVKFTDLDAWQYGHELVIAIYKATKNWPASEQFGLPRK